MRLSDNCLNLIPEQQMHNRIPRLIATTPSIARTRARVPPLLQENATRRLHPNPRCDSSRSQKIAVILRFVFCRFAANKVHNAREMDGWVRSKLDFKFAIKRLVALCRAEPLVLTRSETNANRRIGEAGLLRAHPSRFGESSLFAFVYA